MEFKVMNRETMLDPSTRDKPGMLDKQRDAQNEELLLFQYVVPSSPWAQGLHKCCPSPILTVITINIKSWILSAVGCLSKHLKGQL